MTRTPSTRRLLDGVEVGDLATRGVHPRRRVNDVQSLKTVRRVMDFIALFLPLWPMLVLYAIYTTKKKLKTA